MTGLLTPVVALLLALMISVTLIPLMMRLAPKIGMIDLPDPRKVHALPIPRVGGVGIAGGALVALVLFAPWTPALLAFVLGSAILIFFGTWDDIKEIGHYPKFLGQIAAAALMIWLGDVWVQHLPFIDQPLPAAIGKPFTLIAIVGVINAINHSDGLDGLAGGESLLSLSAMSFLAFLSGDMNFLIMTAAIGGGLLGFLRFNTWPARVFMGDLGSQFLGFSIAVCAIMLTQQVNTSVSKAIALLLIGLPVVDILAVLFQRIRSGMNWFRASKNHIHHRLLELNLDHYQAVLIIYAVQAVLTFGAIALAYESDLLVVLLYVLVCGSLFAGLIWAESKGWRVPDREQSWLARLMTTLNERHALVRAPLYFIKISVPIYLLVSSLILGASTVFSAIGWLALLPMIFLVFLTGIGPQRSALLYRLSMFSTIAILIYCHYSIQGSLQGLQSELPLNVPVLQWQIPRALEIAYIAALALSVSWAGFALKDEFKVTTMDFLIVIGLITAAVFSRQVIGIGDFWVAVIKMTVLFYGCELLMTRSGWHWNRILSGSAVGALGIVMIKLAI